MTPGVATPVLVVDDNFTNRLALRAALAPLGYPVYEADSGRQALRSVMAHDFAVILLDVCMPSMDGFELQRRLAARNYRIPIIFITSFDSDDLRLRAFQAGAVEFLGKPFSQESLFQAVRSALANQQEET